MRIVMMATGGIGGFLAVRMTQAGHEVVCIARGAHLEAIKSNGLTLTGAETSETVHPWKVTESVDGIGPVDAVILGVKAGGLEAAAKAVLPIVNDQAQNGDFSRFVFGETDNTVSPRIQALQTAMTGSGIQADVPADIAAEVWTKIVLMSAMAGTTASARTTVGNIRSTPALARVFQDVMIETHKVGLGKGIPLCADLPEKHWEYVATLPESMRASAAIDLEKGNPLEIPWINGAIVRTGQQLGIPTPVNQTINAILTPFANGRPNS